MCGSIWYFFWFALQLELERGIRNLAYTCIGLATLPAYCAVSDDVPHFDRDIMPLIKMHCVKCHGPLKREGHLNLSTPFEIVRGNDRGAVIAPHDLEASRLWKQVESDAMPPESPLTESQKSIIERWIRAGSPGLPTIALNTNPSEHWAFRPHGTAVIPTVAESNRLINEVDYFIQANREQAKIVGNPEADRRTLIRRVSLDVIGLPPSLEELETFLSDPSSDWYERMVEYYLASPQFGIRWGKHWLDAVGYADSNGYFNADSDRPLAFRYRDYVVRSLNQDKAFDRFIVEQFAGDELACFVPDQTVTPETVELLEATHFLRNGQDGSGESDGNPDEVRADRYYALESVMQNTSSALLGLTIQCAKCHDHKYEPLSQLDYYRWQAIFYPTFNIEHWVNPKDRVVYAALPDEQKHWEEQTKAAQVRVVMLREELTDWMKANQVRGNLLFEDSFDSESARVADRWSETAPGDDSPGGSVPVKLDSEAPPAAMIKNGRLHIIEGGTQGDSWLSTKSKFDWTPDKVGDAIQVTFDLVDNKLQPDGQAAYRIGYFIALHDFDDSSSIVGGNLLIDGNPTEGTAVHLDYPGADSRSLGTLGSTSYAPGKNYGVRVTNLGKGKFRLEQLIDSFPDDKPIDLSAKDLPDGAFGFEFCCGRSFIVDNVIVESIVASPPPESPLGELKKRQDVIALALKMQRELVGNRPGKIAWAGDMSSQLPEVHLLTRGNYSARGEIVKPGTFTVLGDEAKSFVVSNPMADGRTSGRRLAWIEWITQSESRAAALMARVQVNRLWQHYFGRGIVTTPDNLGISGAPPTHPELLDWLASKLIHKAWSMKAIHRIVLNSATYRQSSRLQPDSHHADQDNRLLWRYAPRRLEAETIRDQMLAVSGELDTRMGGPYIQTSRQENGEVVVPEDAPGRFRRSIYLNQKRTQVVSFLNVFDAPSIVFNSVRRNTSTMSLQALSLLNSDFSVRRSKATAVKFRRLESDDLNRLTLAYQIFYCRRPNENELTELMRFLNLQTMFYSSASNANDDAWQDLCQSLFASSEFIYVD